MDQQSRQCHYVLRVLKTSLWDSRCQTFLFESRITQGIQKWVLNNQLQALLSNIFFFKKLISEQKMGCFVDFWILWQVQNQLKYYQNVKKLSFLSYETFLFENQVFSCYYRYNRLFKNSNTWFSEKNYISKNWSVFNILVNFQLILQFNFSKLV